jgi:RimJ/RimL family protein N-acetyltransferase
MKEINITLRALSKNDIDKTLVWHNQEDIRELYLGHPFPINREMEELWYNKILTSNYPTTVFGIETCDKKELIGLSFLKDINIINRSAEFAIYIGDRNQRTKGFSKEATLETLRFGFERLGLNRIYLKVLVENIVAVKLYQKLGFAIEGTLRECVFKNNKFENELLMSFLARDYNNFKDSEL